MSWVELKLSVPRSAVDSVSNFLIEQGSQGVQELDEGERASVIGYFSPKNARSVQKKARAYLKELGSFFREAKAAKLSAAKIEGRRWADEYKKVYFAQHLTRLFYLKPAWDEKTEIPTGMIAIEMDPGQAFGTGLHPSTKLSLKHLEWAVSFYPSLGEVKFIDIGTGTGILAIAAAKLGIGEMTAVDIDPLAVEAAAENLTRNHVSGVRVGEGSLAGLPGRFDVIISNILLETHRELMPLYKERLERGGHLILAGVLSQQKAELDELAREAGLVEVLSETMQEWVAVTYSHLAA